MGPGAAPDECAHCAGEIGAFTSRCTCGEPEQPRRSGTVEGGVIRQLSVSQVESFDPEQVGGCPRRWYFERIEGRRPEKVKAQTDGDIGHALLATHLTGGALPKRSRMLKAVKGAIATGKLPAPGPHLLVERRFDGQGKAADGKHLPLDTSKTLWLGGLPWDGYVDLRYRRESDGVVCVVDHKFSSDINQFAKSNGALIRTVQMPVYALDSLRIWPDADRFLLAHHYVSRRGVDSFPRGEIVTVEQIHGRAREVEQLVEQMQQVARATTQDDVPHNRRACDAWMGCPHQSICKAFKKGKAMAVLDDLLTDEDRETFGLPPRGAPKAATNAPVEIISQTDVTTEEIPLVLGGAEPPVPLPVASTPQAQPPPACGDCGAELTPENGSRLTSGAWKHIGCPAGSEATAQPTKRRGRPPKKQPEACTVCGEPGAHTLPTSGLQEHVGCKGRPEGESPPYTPVLVDGPRLDGHRVPDETSATLPPASAETTTTSEPTSPSSEFISRKPTVDVAERARLISTHPLAGTLRVELDVSGRLASLLERIADALVKR
ncbi:hypothetical protein MYSTI_01962 [Myxococcus stipitatus DSM 14675]|uniref:PD-(D/E)XK endonuclease-like domain-containing protein n=1 Tax=Myxococcus stipitatus (strain DSM 14675 / JCM 12634 / Mx s8) TaxID=1278073 RepID=L7U3D2_MYXSD|nr:PD-(D/E)XK nuclease family protein [Myxococcus stipitatus]AGC43291.1 hypothetical protein MYSTI_01962 [Myxococcus stipitatus DSM 14675]